MANTMWTHEESYRYPGITGAIHRNRLKTILKIFKIIDISQKGKFADFGCSNGYIISLLKDKVFNNGKKWNFYGFDYAENLLTQARNKKLEDAEFHSINLNVIDNNPWSNQFDLVICFETLEHVGNYKNAFINLYNSSKIGGKIIVSLPNEKGVPGLLKYFGRRLLRKNAYGNFFNDQSEIKYIFSLLLNRPIHTFRLKQTDCWAEHLGFDWKEFTNFINEQFIINSKCKLTLKTDSFFRFNLLYVFEKVG